MLYNLGINSLSEIKSQFCLVILLSTWTKQPEIYEIHMKYNNDISSLVAQMVKRLSTIQETKVRSPGWEDSPGEGNDNPLQYYCLENPMEGGMW